MKRSELHHKPSANDSNKTRIKTSWCSYEQLNNRRAGLQHRRSLLLNRPDVILKLILKNRRFYIYVALTCEFNVTLSTRRLLESTTALRCSAHLVSSAAAASLHGQNQKTAQINTLWLLLLLMLLLPPEGQQRGGDTLTRCLPGI